MKKFLREYRLEITASVIAVLGIFLVSQRGRIETFLKVTYSRSVQYLGGLNQTLQTDVQRSLQSLSLSELIGWLLVLLAVPFVIYRIRHRFTESEHWRASECPKCGGELHRIHRHFFDRLLSRTLMPHAHRYKCTNQDCGWSGLRRSRHQDQPAHPLKEATDTP